MFFETFLGLGITVVIIVLICGLVAKAVFSD